MPAILMVNSLADSGTGTLRDAINASVNHTTDGLGQTGTGNDTIQFSRSIDGGAIALSTFIISGAVDGPSAFLIGNSDKLVIDGQTGLSKGITIQRSHQGFGGSGPLIRLFDVNSSSSLTLEGLTLSGGIAKGFEGGAGGGGGGGAAGLGGAIFNQGMLTILDSTLTGNTAQGGAGYAGNDASGGGGGGGLDGQGLDSSFYTGSDGGAGGAPYGGGGGYFTSPSGRNGGGGGGGGGGFAHLGVPMFTGPGGAGGFGGGGGGGGAAPDDVAGNHGGNGGNGGFGGGGGGAGWVGHALGGQPGHGGFGGGDAVRDEAGGGAGMGGAIFNEGGTVVITNSTISGNTAVGGAGGHGYDIDLQNYVDGKPGEGLGGGLFNLNGTVTINSSTFADDTADQAGRGIFNLGSSIIATAIINNTIIGQADETPVADFTSVAVAGGVSVAVGGGDLIRSQIGFEGTDVSTADPLLGPLQNNGGLTPTMALLPGSPAIDAGFPLTSTDQRGVSRDPDNAGKVDIGAYELTAWNMIVNTGADETVPDSTLSLREAINLANGTLSLDDLSAAERAQVTFAPEGGNTITFDSSLDGSTLTFSTVGDSSVGPSAFLVNNQVEIDGPSGNSGVTLSAAGATMRLFDVTSTGNLTLQNLTLSGGDAKGFAGGNSFTGAGGGSAGLGGGIFNQGSLSILSSTLTGNTALGGAGGGFQASQGYVINGGAGGAGLDAAGGSAVELNGSTGGGPNGGTGSTSLITNGADGGFGGGGGGGFSNNGSISLSGGGAGGFGGGGGGAPLSNIANAGGSGGFGGGGGGGGGGVANGPVGPGGAGGYGGGAGGSSVTYGYLPGLGGGGGGGAGMGGAIFNEGGHVIITNSTFTRNTATGGAGGTFISAGSISSGKAGMGLGGGLFNHNGTIDVTNSTFSANNVVQGDGSTLIAAGRGIFNLGSGLVDPSNPQNVSINNTIIGQSDTAVQDLTNAGYFLSVFFLTSGNGNLIRGYNGVSSKDFTIVSTADPLLGPLQNNGGPTPTMALAAGSPAINAGISGAGIPTTDQRGSSRDGNPDIGAFEFAKVSQTITFGPLSPVTYGVGPLTLTATSSSGLPVTFSVISGPGSISGNMLTVTGAGNIVVEADQAGDANYNAAAAVQQTLVVNKANQTINFSKLSSVTYGVGPLTLTATSSSGLPVTFSVVSGPGSISGNTLTVTGAGSIVVEADQAGNANFNQASTGQILVVNKADQTITFSPLSPVTYGVDPITLTATSSSGLPVTFKIDSGPGSISGNTLTVTGAGNIVVEADQTGNANYFSTPAVRQTLVVNKADQTITFGPLSPVTFGVTPLTLSASGGASSNPVTFSVISGPGSISGNMLTVTGAGSIVVEADQAGNANYNAAAAVQQTLLVNKANALFVVTGYSATYDGNTHTATGTATGVGGIDLSSSLSLSGTTHTNAGAYANDVWTFAGGANYNDASGSVTDSIAKADALVSVNGYTGTYDATAHGATGSISGVDAGGTAAGTSLNLGASFTDAPGGTAHWVFTGGTNYNDQSGDVGIIINKATASIDITPYTTAYDGKAHAATGIATGVGGVDLSSGLTLTGTTHTNAGTYNGDVWSFAGGTDYSDASGTVDDSIAKANATIGVTGYSVTYDGNSHTATGTATGVQGESLSGLDLSGTMHTDAGTYSDSWTFIDSTGNYNDASGTATDTIAKADAFVSVNGYTGTYDATAHGATGSVSGVDAGDTAAGTSLYLGASFTNAPGGIAHWVFSGGTNYNDQSGDVAIVINKATASINITPYSVTYDGNAHTATGTATGVGGVDLGAGLTLSGTTHTNAGTYKGDAWSFAGGTDYNDSSGTVDDSIAKANATVNVQGYTGTYDATAHGANGSVTGVDVGGTAAGTSLNLGASFTNAPGGTAKWTFSGGTNYNDQSGDVAIIINKAQANVTVTGYTGVYDAHAHGATGSVTGVDAGGTAAGTSLNLGASFTNAPGGIAHWTFSGGTNYFDQSGDVAIVITARGLNATASTQSALNIAKNGMLSFQINVNTGGIVDGQSIAQLFDGMSFSLSVGGRTYSVQAVASVTDGMITVSFRMTDDLKALLAAFTSAKNASNAPTVGISLHAVSKDGNYALDATASTRLFNSTK